MAHARERNGNNNKYTWVSSWFFELLHPSSRCVLLAVCGALRPPDPRLRLRPHRARNAKPSCRFVCIDSLFPYKQSKDQRDGVRCGERSEPLKAHSRSRPPLVRTGMIENEQNETVPTEGRQLIHSNHPGGVGKPVMLGGNEGKLHERGHGTELMP